MTFKNKLLLIGISLLAMACAMQPTQPTSQPASTTPINTVIHQQHLASLVHINTYNLKGRLGVVTQKQGFSGGIVWKHQATLDEITVYSPLGGKLADITKKANGVSLVDQNGNSVTAQDVESLTETTMGFRLPLTGLSDWVIGRPSDGKIDAAIWNDQGQLTQLKQAGWDIVYENYRNQAGVFLPNKIVLKSEQVNLKLIVENWALPIF